MSSSSGSSTRAKDGGSRRSACCADAGSRSPLTQPMTLKIYNTLTRALEAFQPLDPPRVNVYACGPTVYDFPHIGNFRAFLGYDLLHRYLEWSGYQVRLVVNLTDVDDRTIDAAARRGV